MPPDLAATIAQFGAAGLIAWMWLVERRAATERERQITEAHERIVRDREDRAVLVDAVRDAARAMAALEAGQRALTRLLERVASDRPPANAVPTSRDSMHP